MLPNIEFDPILNFLCRNKIGPSTDFADYTDWDKEISTQLKRQTVRGDVFESVKSAKSVDSLRSLGFALTAPIG